MSLLLPPPRTAAAKGTIRHEFLRHGQIYQSDVFVPGLGQGRFRLRPESIVPDEFAPAIPWRAALLHCPPPLYRLASILNPLVETVNHHPTRAGVFRPELWGIFNRS
jgi:hypothetical protein